MKLYNKRQDMLHRSEWVRFQVAFVRLVTVARFFELLALCINNFASWLKDVYAKACAHLCKISVPGTKTNVSTKSSTDIHASACNAVEQPSMLQTFALKVCNNNAQSPAI